MVQIECRKEIIIERGISMPMSYMRDKIHRSWTTYAWVLQITRAVSPFPTISILGNVAHFLFRQKIEIQSRCALFHFLVYLVITLICNCVPLHDLDLPLRVLTLKISSTVPKKDEKKNPHLEVDHRFVKTTNLLSILVGILYYKQQK